MTVYVDTSVVVRVLLREPNPVRSWGQWNKAYSSALWRVEALRTVDRLRLTHDISDTEVASWCARSRLPTKPSRFIRSHTESFSEQAKPFLLWSALWMRSI